MVSYTLDIIAHIILSVLRDRKVWWNGAEGDVAPYFLPSNFHMDCDGGGGGAQQEASPLRSNLYSAFIGN